MLQRAHSLETYGVDPHPCKVTLVENKYSLAVRPGVVDIDKVPLLFFMNVATIYCPRLIYLATLLLHLIDEMSLS